MSWKKVKLGDLCDMNSGGTPRRNNPDYYNGDIPWAKISDIESANGFIETTEEKISIEALQSIGNRIFPKGTLLLAMYGSVGKTAITGIEMSTNQAILGIRPKDESKIYLPYLKYWFHFIKESLMHRAVGGTLQNISLGIVKELQIPLPPLPIQQKIAAILDQADALRKKDRQLLTKYDELLQAVFYDMFGDPVKNEKGFAVKQLGSLIEKKEDLVDGPFGSSVNTKVDYIEKGEIPVIRTKNVYNFEFVEDDLKFMTREKYETIKRSQVLPGDIILTKVGTIGNVCIFPEHLKEGVLSTTGSCRIRPNEKIINKQFLLYVLHLLKPFLLRLASEGVQAFLNMSHIKSIPIILPDIKKQNAFGILAQNIQKQKLQVKQQIEQSETLFQSLLQQAFKEELVKE